MVNAISLVFRKIFFEGTEHEKKEDLIVFGFKQQEEMPMQVLADKIWKQFIKENRNDVRTCYIPGTQKNSLRLKLEAYVVLSDREEAFDERLLCSLISNKITDAEEACATLFEISSIAC